MSSAQSHKRISILLGTKGQMIKMIPVFLELDRRGVRYTYIHTAQHKGTCERLARVFGVREPDYWLSLKQEDLATFGQMVKWFVRVLARGVRLGRQMWPRKGGYVLLHGDTESTLLGLLLAKLFGQRVVHVEAGLRSGSLRDPFPEEGIRRIVDRFSHVLYAPDERSFARLARKGARVVNTSGNTVFDTLSAAFAKSASFSAPEGEYVVASVHRKETLYSPERLQFAVDAILKAAALARVLFVVHKNTRHALEKAGLYSVVSEHANIELFDRFLEYPAFMRLARGSLFVVTDGGGLQEETWWMDVPCLLLRNRTEREYGLGETAVLSSFSTSTVDAFMASFTKHRRNGDVLANSPAHTLVSDLVSL